MSGLQEAWELFKQGVASTLRQWTALQLAVENNWGDGDCRKKYEQLESQIVDMFRVSKALYHDELEDFLVDYLECNFSLFAEDESPSEVSMLLIEMFQKCGRLDFSVVNAVLQQEKVGNSSVMKSVTCNGMDDSDIDEDDNSEGNNEIINGSSTNNEQFMEVEDPPTVSLNPPQVMQNAHAEGVLETQALVTLDDGWEHVSKSKNRRKK